MHMIKLLKTYLYEEHYRLISEHLKDEVRSYIQQLLLVDIIQLYEVLVYST